MKANENGTAVGKFERTPGKVNFAKFTIFQKACQLLRAALFSFWGVATAVITTDRTCEVGDFCEIEPDPIMNQTHTHTHTHI